MKSPGGETPVTAVIVLNGVLERPSFVPEAVALSTYQTMPVKVIVAVRRHADAVRRAGVGERVGQPCCRRSACRGTFRWS